MNVTAYSLALRFLNMQEIAGERDHPFIVWAHSLCGLTDTPDEVPWCSSWVNAIAWMLRLPRSKSALARSWLRVGYNIPLDAAQPAFDVVVLSRGKGVQPGPENVLAPGHVGFYAGQKGNYVEILGGNQNDTVSVQLYPKSRILGVRRLR